MLIRVRRTPSHTSSNSLLLLGSVAAVPHTAAVVTTQELVARCSPAATAGSCVVMSPHHLSSVGTWVPGVALWVSMSITVAATAPLQLIRATGIGAHAKGDASDMSQGRRGRRTPTTDITVTRTSDLHRALIRVVTRDGVTDPEERNLLALLHQVQGAATWANWGRKARNSVEDIGYVNECLERERREIVQLYGVEPLEA